MGMTVVTTLALEAVPLLLDASGSVEVAVLEITLVNERPVLGAVMVTVKLVLKPTGQLVMVGQMMDPLLFVPPLVALTNVVLVGHKSLTIIFVAVLGPMLVTVTV